MEIFEIEMGEKVKDSITGFSGVVTARAEYITGCRQYTVTPKCKGGKHADSYWFDEARLLESVKKSVSKKPKGGPQQFTAPLKQ